MDSRATILITARNSETTIQRAVESAVLQGDYPILLVDDFSSDKTVALAGEAGGSRLKIVHPPIHKSLGATRNTALMALETPYAVWLDSDDELLPGRVDRLVHGMETENADLIADGAELYDGSDGTYVRDLEIPGFLFGRHPLARLFERNYLPGPGVIGFRTRFAQEIGYDSHLHGSEDMDFLLRSIRSGARFHLLPSKGYRLYAYPQSVSRILDRQRLMYRTSLLKHSYSAVKDLYAQAGHSERITAWALASFSLFRKNYHHALQFIEEAAAMMQDPAEVLEPDGASDAPEGWRVSFHRGTTLLLLGETAKAFALLREAEAARPTPEGANNLGVALRKLGSEREAQNMFRASLTRHPGFHDARRNLLSDQEIRITTHPSRAFFNRSDYAALRNSQHQDTSCKASERLGVA